MKFALAVLLSVIAIASAQYGSYGQVKPQLARRVPVDLSSKVQSRIPQRVALPRTFAPNPIIEKTIKEMSSYSGQMPQTVRPQAFPTKQDPKLCSGLSAGTKLANPSNEHQFWICLEDGEVQCMECPANLVYHPESEQCENTQRPLLGCLSNPCLNGGLCSELEFKRTVCQCQPGFSGDYCEKTDACAVSSCGFDGICIAQPAGSPVDKLCIWERGQKYGIEYSRAEINPCLSGEILKTYPSNLSTSVYIQCEGSIPHLKFCPLSSFYNHMFGRCEWSTENTQVLPKLSFEQQTYGSGY